LLSVLLRMPPPSGPPLPPSGRHHTCTTVSGSHRREQISGGGRKSGRRLEIVFHMHGQITPPSRHISLFVIFLYARRHLPLTGVTSLCFLLL
jgi:hypothetical protein